MLCLTGMVINMLGLIAGTGFYNWEALENQQEKQVYTPYGTATVFVGEVAAPAGRKPVVFLPRHAKNHTIPPHKINYRANIWALQSLGVDKIIAVNAVGSLLKEVPPGSIVLVDDFLDFTYGREHTFFTGGEAGLQHTDMTNCYDRNWQEVIAAAADKAGVPLVKDGIYVCVQGPRFETRAEIRAYAKLGGTVSGMTGVPEVTLANELGLKYGSLALVTNFCCGLASAVSDDEVRAVMAQNTAQLAKILLQLVCAY